MRYGRTALTGSIACGKSAIVQFLRELDVPVLDADDVVHELEGPGGAAVPRIVSEFGEGVLAPDGSVDRKRLSAQVFASGSSNAKERLEAIIHPMVRERMRSFNGLCVIPLLFETGWEGDYDFIACVTSPEDVQVKRMMENRGYSRDEAVRRIKSQMPQDEKAARSDYVIPNFGTLAELRKAAIDFSKILM